MENNENRWDWWNTENWEISDEEISQSWWEEKIDQHFEEWVTERTSGE